ncbi:MAG: hypothetical protein RLZZ324_889 [Candidatus Parcubacteria bacterium]|jgi:hypothetical protein
MEPQSTLKTSTKIIAVALPLALILVGAGCMDKLSAAKDSLSNAGKQVSSATDKLVKAAATPVTKPLKILEKSKADISVIQARKNDQDDQVADDLPVGMIKTGAGKGGDAVGCGDTVVMTPVHREAQTDNSLSDRLITLFAQKSSSVANGLYNALWGSSLAVDKIVSHDGVTTEVYLKGRIVSGGACDVPRIKSQIEATVARTKPDFKIFLNGTEKAYRCMGDSSGQCK